MKYSVCRRHSVCFSESKSMPNAYACQSQFLGILFGCIYEFRHLFYVKRNGGKAGIKQLFAPLQDKSEKLIYA